MELSQDIFEQISLLSAAGDELATQSNFDAATSKYQEALQLLPGDHRRWKAATWLYVALGDSNFQSGDFDRAFRSFFNAVQCPEGLGNPFIHLRLGQTYLEAGNLEKAADELTRAYMGGGLEIFLEDDPKYIDFLATQIDIEGM